MELNVEMWTKIVKTESVEELFALAKEVKPDVTMEEAAALFARSHKNGKLADDELDNVAGGCGDSEETYPGVSGPSCPDCGNSYNDNMGTYRDEEGRLMYKIRCRGCGKEFLFHHQFA